MAIPKKQVHKNGSPTKAPIAQKKGTKNDAYGFGDVFASPDKKLKGPVGVTNKAMNPDKKRGRPDRALKGPVGAVSPIPSKAKSPRKPKAK